MAQCDRCGEEEPMPYRCRLCGGTYCSEHRLPENHDCPGLDDWGDPSGVFDSGFDDSVATEGGTRSSGRFSLPFDTGPGGLLAYFRGNMTYVFLGLMWLTFLLEYVVAFALPPAGDIQATLFSSEAWRAIFVLSSEHPEYVWTWITSVFSHAGFFHIAVNSIVIYFFGTLVERYIGSRSFSALFVVSGAVAGLAQIGLAIVQSAPAAVVGASGAGLAIMGVLTVLNPGLRVYLYFVIPMPLWLLTLGYAALSIIGGFGALGGSALTGNTAHVAHLVGLVIGLAYGYHVQDRVSPPSQFRFGGGPGGPGGPGGRRRI